MNLLPLAALLSVSLSSCAVSSAQPQPESSASPGSNFGRVLIVSGGPDAKYNQYAIESNARYVASLTKNAAWRRVLFADGDSNSKTISAVLDNAQTRARAVVSWMWDLDAPPDATELKAPTLKPISGAATPDSITQSLAQFGQSHDASAPQLVYFTGHGSPGKDGSGRDDYTNTLYAAWGDDYSARQLARALQAGKSAAPLVLVMVQCHGGGFANAMFQEGDPAKPIWKRDFCGFFASVPERMAAGCTSQVNERDYQDFTTHFFAALSGVSRDGRRVSGADYDHNGRVSLDEAYAYAQINDDSIDVPLSTSDAFLRHEFGTGRDLNWQQTPFSRLLRDATPSQRAVLNELKTKLRLRGAAPLSSAQKRANALQENSDEEAPADFKVPPGTDQAAFGAAYDRLESLLKPLAPGLKTPGAVVRKRVLFDAAALLAAHPADLDTVYRAYSRSTGAEDAREVEEARLLRFLRQGRSILLAKRLEHGGTTEQKAVFARLRASEGRSAF